MRSGVRRGGWVVVVAAFALLVSGCDDGGGPAGPGSYQGTVRASVASLGAVVLELTGPGIVAVEGTGDTRAFEPTASTAEPDRRSRRVVLVSDVPGPLTFRVRVDDLGAGPPRAVVRSAVDGENEPVLELESFSVSLER